jgi:hypothetical protein
MTANTGTGRGGFARHQSRQVTHSMPKHVWDEEVVRVIKASKGCQRRLAGWASELTNVHPPVAASRARSGL